MNILGFRKQVPFDGNTLQGSFGRKSYFGLGLKERKIEEKKGLPSPYSLYLLSFHASPYLYGCISPLYELISFSRVLM